MVDFFLIAEIKTVMNNDGFVSLILHTDFPDRFYKLKKVYVDIFGGFREFFIEKCNIKGQSVLLKFRNFDTDDELLALNGKKIYINSDESVQLTDDEFFVHELIDSEVFQASNYIGKISDVLKLPCHDVYVIKQAGKDDILIPAVKVFIESFSREERILRLKEGTDIKYYDED